MMRLTVLPTLALGLALALPYTAPPLCDALRADMHPGATPAGQQDCPSQQEAPTDTPSTQCDFGACATAPVAPPPAAAVHPAVFPVLESDVAAPAVSAPGDPLPPPTPPPLA